MTNIEKSILTSVVLADVFGMPLSVNCDSIVNRKGTACRVLTIIEKSEALRNKIHVKDGFFYLEQNVLLQQEIHEKTGLKKWKIVKKFVKFFRCIPFIQEIFVSGSLARGNTVEDSDIDLLVITKHGRIWTARMFIYLITFVTGKHRHGKKSLSRRMTGIKNRFCLNHFISDKNLEIKHQSLYNAETYLHLVPILGNRDVIDNFRKANQWVKKYFPYSDGAVADDAIPCKCGGTARRVRTSLIKKFIEFILGGFIGNAFEAVMKKIQIMKQLCSRRNDHGGSPSLKLRRTEGRVILSDNELEFHPDSPEGGVMEKFEQKMRELMI